MKLGISLVVIGAVWFGINIIFEIMEPSWGTIVRIGLQIALIVWGINRIKYHQKARQNEVHK